MPAIAGGVAPPGQMDALAGAGGGQQPAGGSPGDAAQSQRDDTIGAIRDITQMAMERLGKQQNLAPELQQLQQIMRQMLIKAVQASSTQTSSAEALPMAGN